MSMDAKSLLSEALKLPEQERADLVEELLESMGEEPPEDVDAAWGTEVARRLEELRSGKVRAVPWDEAKKAIWGDGESAK